MKLGYKILSIVITLGLLTYLLFEFSKDKVIIKDVKTEVEFFDVSANEKSLDILKKTLPYGDGFIDSELSVFKELDCNEPEDENYGEVFVVSVSAKAVVPSWFEEFGEYRLKYNINTNKDIFFMYEGEYYMQNFSLEYEEEEYEDNSYFSEDGYYQSYWSDDEFNEYNKVEDDTKFLGDYIYQSYSDNAYSDLNFSIYGCSYGMSKEEVLDIVEDLEIELEYTVNDYCYNVKEYQNKIKCSKAEVVEDVYTLPNIE